MKDFNCMVDLLFVEFSKIIRVERMQRLMFDRPHQQPAECRVKMDGMDLGNEAQRIRYFGMR